MSIESELRRDGIEIVSKLDTLEVNSIAKTIADKLTQTFPKFKLNSTDLFMRLSRLNMYRAKMPDGLSEANYFYKNSSIYFNEHIPFEDLHEFAIHECIHYLQEVKDKRNYLIRMGLCDFTEFNTYGLGLNEAAVQLMSATVIGIQKEEVKYFGITFISDSPSYYPLECNLVRQMASITGEDVLFESTFFSNDNFKNKFIELTSEKVFYAVQNAIDTILFAEEDIIKINNKIQTFDDRNQKVDILLKRIDELKNKISVTFMRTQNLILSSYFDKKFDTLSNLEELENYRRELSKYRELTGIADGYTFFNNYYLEKMSQLEHKYNVLENGGTETAIDSIRISKLTLIFRAIKKLLFGSKETEKDV